MNISYKIVNYMIKYIIKECDYRRLLSSIW